MHRIANVKWVKISTDIFDNSKIKYIRRLPDGDTLALVWIALLAIAGRCNANGYVYLTEDIPYTSQMLADELGVAEPTIAFALSAFSQLKMIENHSGFIYISSWAEHQNVDGLDRIREQTRKRVAKHRESRKLLLLSGGNSCNVTGNATVTQTNATEEEREKERDIDIYTPSISPSQDEPTNCNATKKRQRKVFIPPSVEEIAAYCKEKGYNVNPQEFHDYYDAANWHDSEGKPVLSWKQRVVTWSKREKNNQSKGVLNNGTFERDYSIIPDGISVI